jgi:hypothetical protein
MSETRSCSIDHQTHFIVRLPTGGQLEGKPNAAQDPADTMPTNKVIKGHHGRAGIILADFDNRCLRGAEMSTANDIQRTTYE